jgi:hypothetical protein
VVREGDDKVSWFNEIDPIIDYLFRTPMLNSPQTYRAAMEALAAVALAGNVAQFIEYSIKAVLKTYELLDNPSGALAELEELRDVADSVEQSLQSIRNSPDVGDNGSAMPGKDKVLEALVANCLSVSGEITAVLGGLELDAPAADFFQAVQKRARAVLKKPELKQLCGRLHCLRDQISAHLLVLIK